MAWQVFGTLSAGNQNASLFDTLSGQIAVNVIVKCSATGTNAIALTTDASNGPPISSYITQQHFSFIAANTATGAVTVNVASLGALKLFAFDSVTQLGSGSIVAGREYIVSYNAALDSGMGGFQLMSVTSPGLVLIETKTASVSATLDFTTGITSSFDQYIFVLTGVGPDTNSTNFIIQISTDGGSTWKFGSTDYQWVATAQDVLGTTGTASSASDADIQVAGLCYNGSTVGLFGQISMNAPASAAVAKPFITDIVYPEITGPGVLTRVNGAGYYIGSFAAINGVRFRYSSGNILNGIISLYGIAK